MYMPHKAFKKREITHCWILCWINRSDSPLLIHTTSPKAALRGTNVIVKDYILYLSVSMEPAAAQFLTSNLIKFHRKLFKLVLFPLTPVLGHPQKVVKKEIKSLSTHTIHPWPWGNITLLISPPSSSRNISLHFHYRRSPVHTAGSALRQKTSSLSFFLSHLWGCKISSETLCTVPVIILFKGKNKQTRTGM